MLKVRHITKRFAGVTALEDVSLELQKGKVTAIIGENGAGKTTLMKILSGVYQEYEGDIEYNGNIVHFANPAEAQVNGIAIMHQELNLIPNLSIAENIFLGREAMTPSGFLDKKLMNKRSAELLKSLKLFVDPDTRIIDLKVGQQQVVEIAQALLTDSDVIIMDEPTSAISEGEVAVLFEIIENLRSEGKTIIYISHKLDELFRIADCYIVMRDGRFIGSGNMRETTHDDIIRMMVGREIRVLEKPKRESDTGSLLSVRNICLKHPSKENTNLLKNISFNLGRGEILGIYGLMGAGRTELLETLFGLKRKIACGTVYVEGKEVKISSPTVAINAGLALVPEDRKSDGLVLNMNVRSNISMAVLKEIVKFGMLNNRKESALAGKYIKELNVKTPSDLQIAKNLSGGNQQKLVLAKWLATKPIILMLDEPTRGIDVNAKNEIYQLIYNLAGSGLGIIIVSSEIQEIIALSDRVLAMSEGMITAEFMAEHLTEDILLKAAIPKTI
jgi:ribose transport system ATP-binding protein